MSDKPSRDRISMAAILLRNKGYDDVAKWLMARDAKTAKKPRKQTAKRVDVADRYGNKARRGSGGKANMENPDIVYEFREHPF